MNAKWVALRMFIGLCMGTATIFMFYVVATDKFDSSTRFIIIYVLGSVCVLVCKASVGSRLFKQRN